MQLFIYTINKTLFEGESTSINAPTESGEITILPHHIPLMTALEKGIVRYVTENEEKKLSVTRGFLYTDGKKTVLLTQ